MYDNEKFLKFVEKYPHRHKNFFDRPYASRRHFLQLASGFLTASWLAPRAQASDVRIEALDVPLLNKAKNCVFILLSGAPSHVDTFDFKITEGVTPVNALRPEQIGNFILPTAIMPRLAEMTNEFAIIRSMRSWALVHSLGQIWAQIGRNPVAALGDIAPNIGSIVAIEKEKERRPGDIFPTFLALNSGNAVGSGYLPSQYSPFKTNAATTGLANVNHSAGEARFNDRKALLETLDGALRADSPYGRKLEDMNAFYKAAQGMMFNPIVDQAFRYTAADRAPYGNTGFGDACLTARKVLAANAGTRFIQITFGGWDDHANIYQDNVLPARTRSLDTALSQLLRDMKEDGTLEDTLIVMVGEFGRTVGRLSGANGRDHYVQQFCFVAGAGIQGGKAIGSTNATGGATNPDDYGWHRRRDIRPEDIEATIYSALGINYTSIRYDDPFGRGFEYVPYAHEDLYAPVKELWA
jgi:hypothetical protein